MEALASFGGSDFGSLLTKTESRLQKEKRLLEEVGIHSLGHLIVLLKR